ncbi:MAG: leucine-rich repeat domain-containing protein [Oscillospiraceae bacterium]|nr:leucine-rich repeat domain-containing protein [Oscillospiraceae bacterium]
MNYSSFPQEQKAEILEDAVINESAADIADVYKALGRIEFSARALGLACRFRGAEIVRLLIGLGATFDFPKTEDAERLYHVTAGFGWSNYRTDFSLYLLNITKQIKGACCCKGLKLLKRVPRIDKKALTQLPDNERGEVLQALCENADKISFSPSELMYYAVFARDEFIISELKRLGYTLSELREAPITNGGTNTDYWYEWLSMTKNLSDEDFLLVMKMMSAEVGEKFHCTTKLYDLTKKRFGDAEAFEFFLDNFKIEKLNKTQIVRDLIEINAVGALTKIEKTDWLKNTKRREETIAYAQEKGDRLECVAWLLDYKNRTADLAAERLRAEKKMERELNASPTSVAMMKKTWSCKKQENGSLIITNYKGTATEVTVPETIGKSTVTAIGNGAFAGGGGLCGGRVTSYATYEQMKVHQQITRLVIPESVNSIGIGAFADMLALTEINIPNGVVEIGSAAFYNCIALGELVIPKTVRSIGEYAFNHCNRLTVVVERKSYAEEYCDKNGIKFRYIKEEK